MDLAKVTCENLGEERDVPLELTRKELEEVCAPALKGLYHLLERAKMGAGMVVAAVELVGGGSRVCAVRNCAGEVFGTSTFGAKLDDASLAHGACFGLATKGGGKNVGCSERPRSPRNRGRMRTPNY